MNSSTRMALRWIAILLAIAFALLSGYGWYFFVTVGETHDAGEEVGLIGGLIALVSLAVATWLDLTGPPSTVPG